MTPPQPTTAELASTVREWLPDVEGHRALDTLAERVETLERERDILFKGDWAALNLRCEELERALREWIERNEQLGLAIPAIARAALERTPSSGIYEPRPGWPS